MQDVVPAIIWINNKVADEIATPGMFTPRYPEDYRESGT